MGYVNKWSMWTITTNNVYKYRWKGIAKSSSHPPVDYGDTSDIYYEEYYLSPNDGSYSSRESTNRSLSSYWSTSNNNGWLMNTSNNVGYPTGIIYRVWSEGNKWYYASGYTNPSSFVEQYLYSQSTTKNSHLYDVSSSNRYAYPDNGISGVYWYVYLGELFVDDPPSIPSSITVPIEIREGKAYTVSHGTSTDPNGTSVTYELSRSVNGGAYTFMYNSGASTIDTALESWNTVTYRVRALSNGLYSGYRTSPTVTVKHAPEVYVNVGGVNKQCDDMWINIDGVWKEVADLYTNIDGVWKVS